MEWAGKCLIIVGSCSYSAVVMNSNERHFNSSAISFYCVCLLADPFNLHPG